MIRSNVWLLSIPFILFSCSAPSEGARDTATDTESAMPDEDMMREEMSIVDVYDLDVAASKATWDRELEQGPTTKEVKLGKTTMTVNMDEVSLTSYGDVSLTGGELQKESGAFTNGYIEFDMTTMKINTEGDDGESLFQSKTYPKSTFKINEIVEAGVSYKLIGELTIAETTQPLQIAGEIVESDAGTYNLSSTFVLQTLDWPLRDAEAVKSVKKDELTIKLNVFFNE